MAGGAGYDLRHFADILDTLDAIVWEADASTFEFTYVSDGATAILGYPPAAWIGVPGFWESLIHPAERDEVVRFCVTATRECRDHRFEYRAIAADGRVVWLEDVVRVVADETGRARLIRGVMTDISARKHAEALHSRAVDALTQSEEALRESEERYRLLSELTSDYAWSVRVDAEGGVIFEWATGAFEELYGQPFDADLMADWTRVVHPEDHEVAFGVLNRLLLGETVEVELRLARPDGGVRWVAVIAQPLRNIEGTIDRIVGSARDVTARRRAEEELRSSERKFRAVFDYAPVGISTVDLQGRVLMCNQHLADMLGYSVEELQKMAFTDYTHPEDVQKGWDLYQAMLRGDIDHLEIEKRYLRSDGSTVWVRLIGSLIRGDDGAALGGMAMIQDVSERHRAREERQQLQHQLLQSQKMEAVGRLAGGIAHDFNNVLGAIINYAEFIRENPDDPVEVRSDAQEIFDAGQRAAALVRQLLMFSRRETPQPQRLNPTEVVRDHARILERTLGEDVRLSFDLAADVPDVIADRLQIEQVLLNLALNARDAMPTGGRLEISVRPQAPDKIALTVRDHGTGMSEEVKSRAYEPFFTTKAPGAGTGLGLSMVYGVVQDMGGSVDIETELGRGTEVTIRLPVAEGTGDVVPAGSQDPDAPDTGMDVLLVEDEAQLRRLVGRLLSKDGHSVIAAADASEALAIASERARPVDILVTDVVMPGMSGIELAARLREQWPDLAVLYLSGYPRDVVEVQGGIDGELLEKPFTAGALRDAIARQRDR